MTDSNTEPPAGRQAVQGEKTAWAGAKMWSLHSSMGLLLPTGITRVMRCSSPQFSNTVGESDVF